MKTLIFLCGYDDFYFRLANMTAHTIRESGYNQEIIIFTIDQRTSEYAQCINLAAHPESHHIMTPKQGGYFHKKLCTQFGYQAYNKPYDFFIIKTLPGTIVKKENYDFILYMDSDILVHSSLNPIFQQYKTIVSDYNSKIAIRDLKGIAKHLTPTERHLAERMTGIGGGSFGVPSTHYRFYEDYRKIYLQYINEIPHDQPALTMTMIRHHNDYTVEKLPNRAYWTHYWGYRKSKMIQDYDAYQWVRSVSK